MCFLDSTKGANEQTADNFLENVFSHTVSFGISLPELFTDLTIVQWVRSKLDTA